MSPYGKQARLVIQRAVPINPSDSDACSFRPWERWLMKTGFFLVMVQRAMALQIKRRVRSQQGEKRRGRRESRLTRCPHR